MYSNQPHPEQKTCVQCGGPSYGKTSSKGNFYYSCQVCKHYEPVHNPSRPNQGFQAGFQKMSQYPPRYPTQIAAPAPQVASNFGFPKIYGNQNIPRDPQFVSNQPYPVRRFEIGLDAADHFGSSPVDTNALQKVMELETFFRKNLWMKWIGFDNDQWNATLERFKKMVTDEFPSTDAHLSTPQK